MDGMQSMASVPFFLQIYSFVAIMKIHNIAAYIRHDQVSSWNFAQRQADFLHEKLPDAEITVYEDEASFCKALQTADACLVWYFRQEWFECAPELKVLSTPSAGRDFFRVTPPRGVHMMYGQFHGELIGETVVGMLLAMTRGIASALTSLANNPWPRRELDAVMKPLRGSHVAILGLGHLGGWIGRLLKPFGVRISGLRRNLSRPAPDWFEEGDCIFGEDKLEQILQDADHVILALPGTADTDMMLNGRRIMMLKQGATVINVGRGNAIDGTSLYSALAAGRISGAFLDVFNEEPLPENSAFRKCPNLWIMPHASAIAPNYLDLYVSDFIRQLDSMPDGLL